MKLLSLVFVWGVLASHSAFADPTLTYPEANQDCEEEGITLYGNYEAGAANLPIRIKLYHVSQNNAVILDKVPDTFPETMLWYAGSDDSLFTGDSYTVGIRTQNFNNYYYDFRCND